MLPKTQKIERKSKEWLAVAGKKMFFVRFGGGLSLCFFLLLQFPKVSLSPQAFFFQFFVAQKVQTSAQNMKWQALELTRFDKNAAG